MMIIGQIVNGQPISIKDDTVTIGMEKISGLGIEGNHSYGIPTNKEYGDSISVAFPKMKNPLTNMHSMVEYFFILDQFQFYFQSYKEGKYDFEFFANKAKRMNWMLADTIFLSPKPIKCGFSLLAGLDSLHEAIYILDANNNNDYSDDVKRYLLKGVYDEANIVNESVSVRVDVAFQGGIKEENILVFVQSKRQSNDEKIDLTFMFPEFRYQKFTFKGIPYLVCSNIYDPQPSIVIVPDRPYFSPVGKNKRIRLGQYAKVEGALFKFIGYSGMGDRITLYGNNVGPFLSSDAPNKRTTQLKDSFDEDSLKSSQVGFLAPTIIGTNVLDGKTVNTDQLRGKYIFIDFWSTACAPCIREFKYMKEVYLQYSRDQVEIIGVVDDRTINKLNQLLQREHVSWPNIKMNTSGTDITGYKILSYPTTYLIDLDGRIIATGLRGEELSSKLKSLIN